MLLIEERNMLKELAFATALLASTTMIPSSTATAADDVPAGSAQAVIKNLMDNPISGMKKNKPNSLQHTKNSDRGITLLITGIDKPSSTEKSTVYGIVDDKARKMRSSEEADYFAFIKLAAREKTPFDFNTVNPVKALERKHCQAVQEIYNKERESLGLNVTTGGCLTAPGAGFASTPGVAKSSSSIAARQAKLSIPMRAPGAAGAATAKDAKAAAASGSVSGGSGVAAASTTKTPGKVKVPAGLEGLFGGSAAASDPAPVAVIETDPSAPAAPTAPALDAPAAADGDDVPPPPPTNLDA